MNDDELSRRAALLVNEAGYISGPLQAFYLHSIQFSAARSDEGFSYARIARESGAGALEQVARVQEALMHAAGLSRFFWPSQLRGGRSKAIREMADRRGAGLRAAFGIPDDSPLKSRGLRDALEHFDERLDSFLLSLDGGRVYPEPMLGSPEASDGVPTHVFKMLDPVSSTFVLFGEKYSYRGLPSEVSRIRRAVESMIANGAVIRPLAPGQSHASE